MLAEIGDGGGSFGVGDLKMTGRGGRSRRFRGDYDLGFLIRVERGVVGRGGLSRGLGNWIQGADGKAVTIACYTSNEVGHDYQDGGRGTFKNKPVSSEIAKVAGNVFGGVPGCVGQDSDGTRGVRHAGQVLFPSFVSDA